MFDLMYCNGHCTRQYAFLRKSGKELLLVAVNFADQVADMSITIPAHAFDYLGISENTYTSTDLLTDQASSITLRRDGAVTLTLPQRGAQVLKMVVRS